MAEEKASVEAVAQSVADNLKIEQGGEEKTVDKEKLKEIFEAFAKFGAPKGTQEKQVTITLSAIDKWMKQAKIFDGKTISTVDTGICFKKLRTKAIDFKTFNAFLEDLAKTKSVPVVDIKEKLVAGGPPVANATKPIADATVARLTDTSKYTGAHKLRFDSSGKGKGKEGREDLPSKDGYVAGYKNKNTFDKTH